MTDATFRAARKSQVSLVECGSAFHTLSLRNGPGNTNNACKQAMKTTQWPLGASRSRTFPRGTMGPGPLPLQSSEPRSSLAQLSLGLFNKGKKTGAHRGPTLEH